MNRAFGALSMNLGMGMGGLRRAANYIVNLMTATCVRASTRTVSGYQTSDILEGPEELRNSVFDSQLNWSTDAQTVLSPSTGQVIATGAAAFAFTTQQITALDAGDTYTVTHVIDEITSGEIRLRLGTSLGTVRTVAGTYQEDLIAEGTLIIQQATSAGFTGKTSKISVKKKTLESLVTAEINEAVYAGLRRAITVADGSPSEGVPVWLSTETAAATDGNSVVKSPHSKAIAIGDSITAGSIATSYVEFVESGNALAVMRNAGDPGDTLTEINARFNSDALVYDGNVIVIQGGINDELGAVADPTSGMLTALTAMVDRAIADGRTPIILNVGPWGNYSLWTAEKQGWTEDYNAAVLSYTSANNIDLVDIYSLLKDGINLAAIYDSGDGLHPNAAGGEVIGDAINIIAAPIYLQNIYVPLPLPDPRGLSIGKSGENSSTAADTISFPTAINITPEKWAFEVSFIPRDIVQFSTILNMFEDADNSLNTIIGFGGLEIGVTKEVATVVTSFNIGYAPTVGVKMRMQCYGDDVDGMGIRAADFDDDINLVSFVTNANTTPIVIPANTLLGNTGGFSTSSGEYVDPIFYASKLAANW